MAVVGEKRRLFTERGIERSNGNACGFDEARQIRSEHEVEVRHVHRGALKPKHSSAGAALQLGDAVDVGAQLPRQVDIDRELELRERTGSVIARSSCSNASNSPRKVPLSRSDENDCGIACCPSGAD